MAPNDLTFVTLCCGLCEPHMSILPVFLHVSIPFQMCATVITFTFNLFTINVSISFPYSCVLKLVMSCNVISQKCMCLSLSHVQYVQPIAHTPSLCHHCNMTWPAQITKVLGIQLSPHSYHLLILWHRLSICSPNVTDQVSYQCNITVNSLKPNDF
jgi:hypothetical protein